ncbi:unnamed protein product [Owenia fusiformis]|uniref:Trimeric intracellular cation channel type 1B.1 n=1 Tax=Owenia fusiformis TaxID=6347 RepID=A0A8S4N560_OWEFU|nr:unnamed protein product [Owenia fusiformis]
MDPQTFLDISTKVLKLKMFPYFHIAHYSLMCIMVREDNHPPSPGSQRSPEFSRKHPLASWMASMLMCFGGGIIGNLLFGEFPLAPFKSHENVIIASATWYLINYSPFDVVYKLATMLPIRITLWVMKEIERGKKVYDGVAYVAKLYPDAYLLMAFMGTIKACGYYYIQPFERLLRGLWMPSTNVLLHPPFVIKASLGGAIIFILERTQILVAPHAVIYFGVVIFFIYFRLSAILLGISDPFVPFENLFSAIFFGGMWDALKKAVEKEKRTENGATPGEIKSKEEKKRD